MQFSVWPYLHWPPLYPMLLAAASFGILDPYAVAGPLNAAIFGLSIFAVGSCLRRYLRHRFLVIGACLAVMLSLPLTGIAAADLAAPFLLHITPADAADLPPYFREYGFENRDFAFRKYGIAFDGKCLAVVPLPDYDILRVRTGQFTPDAGRLWTAEFLTADGSPAPRRR